LWAFSFWMAIDRWLRTVPLVRCSERDVLAMSVRGASVEEVARSLHLTNGTVRNHLSIAIQKLNAHNRTEAARIAEEKGWL